MKLKFKKQEYQTRTVESVVNCFEGQPKLSGIDYRIDPGKKQDMNLEYTGFKNAEIKLSESLILENIQKVQRLQNLPQSKELVKTKVSPVNLDVEMETGTGKTYCYIKTMFEMDKLYGWNKFIVVVPSIAIREGIYKSFEITSEHFQEIYHKKAKFFIYDSSQLHKVESFSSDGGINVMIINIQAFNARGKDARRIYEELDDFQSRKPIDVIKANRPILILDEPQKMEGKKTLDSLCEFNPLFVLRYSATHKTQHNKVHRLDALDAYNQKLVKKIAVRGISVKNLPGTNAYLYLESIEVSKQAIEARIEIEVKQKSGIKRIFRKLKNNDNLYELSGELDQYKGFTISNINAVSDTVEFTNGVQLHAGEATGDVNEMTLRRIQIREAINAHFEKEKVLFHQGIKVLSLFFIDEVAKYRFYSDAGAENGEYAGMFEEEYQDALNEMKQDMFLHEEYKKYLDGISVEKTHNGYFSIDKKGHMIDPKMNKTEKKEGEANDVDAYDLILRDKERLLSFEEPVRFIFSHSALREGWDNTNVFVICTLKHSGNTISRRQEVGRGLRISVNKSGDRQDNPATVHQTNVLTVIASESYKDFVSCLQKEISDTLSERPRVADSAYFKGKLLHTSSGNVEVSQDMAEGIEFYLIQNAYIDRKKNMTQKYFEDKKNEALTELPEDLKEYKEQVFVLIDSVYSDEKLPEIEDDRASKTNPLNDNFDKKEFKELWNRINSKAVYSVKFDSSELVKKCIENLDSNLRVAPLQYRVDSGEQLDKVDYDQLTSGESFKVNESTTIQNKSSVHSSVKYDIIGKISGNTLLTRRTISDIFQGIQKSVFNQFKGNPENFISEASRLIQEQKATLIIEHLTYNSQDDKHDIDIFTDAQSNQNFSRAGEKLKRHIYDYVVTDSKTERNFVEELDTSSEVVVYAKLPRGFFIPTPVGDYNPDWAIAFKEGTVKHIYFVAETKGSMSSLQLKEIEQTKIKCAKKFFDELNEKISSDKVKYDVVDSFGKLMDLVG